MLEGKNPLIAFLRASTRSLLLLKYSSYTRDRKCTKNPKALSAAELKQLLALQKKEGTLPLAELISRLSSESRQNQAPQSYREIFYELLQC